MTDDQLRQLVRDAVARHMAAAAPAAATPACSPAPRSAVIHESAAPATVRLTVVAHASHGQYASLVNAGDACLIEPSVQCNHCGYCRSHGH